MARTQSMHIDFLSRGHLYPFDILTLRIWQHEKIILTEDVRRGDILVAGIGQFAGEGEGGMFGHGLYNIDGPVELDV